MESDNIAEQLKILDNIQNSISKAIKPTCRYIVPKDKDTYDSLLHRLDAYAKRLHGKITGVVDYNEWYAYIVVNLKYFEASTPDDFALLSDIATKTINVIFDVDENEGLELHIMIGYFDEIEYPKLDECIIESEIYNIEKEKALSDPQIADFLAERGKQKGMTADELYDWLAECYRSDHNCLLFLLLNLLDDNENKDTE